MRLILSSPPFITIDLMSLPPPVLESPFLLLLLQRGKSSLSRKVQVDLVHQGTNFQKNGRIHSRVPSDRNYMSLALFGKLFNVCEATGGGDFWGF
jgi:hypothetical protein